MSKDPTSSVASTLAAALPTTNNGSNSAPWSFQMSSTTASFVAGTIGGVAGVVCGHPFDTVKVRLQTQNPLNPLYRGTIHCFSTIVRKEGVSGLFKGMSSPLFGVAAVNSLLFGVYGAFLELQGVHQTGGGGGPAPTLVQIFLAGSGSGMVNALASTPMELVKIRLQNQGIDAPTQHRSPLTFYRLQHNRLQFMTPKVDMAGGGAVATTYTGPVDLIRKLYQKEGARGWYRGFWATVIRETPSYGAYFAAYEVLCRWLAPAGTDPKDLSGVRLMLAGGLGGIAGWAVTYPVDVVKTMIQSEPAPGETKAPSLVGTVRSLYQQQGISSLFRGFLATVVRAFPTNVAILSTFHMSMLYFRQTGLVTNTSVQE